MTNHDPSKPNLINPGSYKPSNESIDQATDEEYREVMQKEYESRDESFTCFHCPDNKRCPLAWDLYNKDGDCIMK